MFSCGPFSSCGGGWAAAAVVAAAVAGAEVMNSQTDRVGLGWRPEVAAGICQAKRQKIRLIPKNLASGAQDIPPHRLAQYAKVWGSACNVTPLFAAFRHAKVGPAIRSTNGSAVSRRLSPPSFLSSASSDVGGDAGGGAVGRQDSIKPRKRSSCQGSHVGPGY